MFTLTPTDFPAANALAITVLEGRLRVIYYLVSGIDYTVGQKEGCNEDCIPADVG